MAWRALCRLYAGAAGPAADLPLALSNIFLTTGSPRGQGHKPQGTVSGASLCMASDTQVSGLLSPCLLIIPLLPWFC